MGKEVIIVSVKNFYNKKPCVIGTKVTTKVFKDGDMLEVDANNGIIRIVERKN